MFRIRVPPVASTYGFFFAGEKKARAEDCGFGAPAVGGITIPPVSYLTGGVTSRASLLTSWQIRLITFRKIGPFGTKTQSIFPKGKCSSTGLIQRFPRSAKPYPSSRAAPLFESSWFAFSANETPFSTGRTNPIFTSKNLRDSEEKKSPAAVCTVFQNGARCADLASVSKSGGKKWQRFFRLRYFASKHVRTFHLARSSRVCASA